jgi:hypothetical protein
MSEEIKNIGALLASTPTAFNLKDPRVFGPAAYLNVRRIEISNASNANLTIQGEGKKARVPRGVPGSIEFDTRTEIVIVTADAAVSDGEVQFILKGDVLPVHRWA